MTFICVHLADTSRNYNLRRKLREFLDKLDSFIIRDFHLTETSNLLDSFIEQIEKRLKK